MSPWRIRGAYFESCNCEAICPCRMVGGSGRPLDVRHLLRVPPGSSRTAMPARST